MNQKIQVITISVNTATASTLNIKQEEFEIGYKYLKGISVNGIPSDPTTYLQAKYGLYINIGGNNEILAKEVKMENLMCDVDYVAPDNRFFTKFPKCDITGKKFDATVIPPAVLGAPEIFEFEVRLLLTDE